MTAHTPQTPPPATSGLQIDLDNLTAILDDATVAWRDVVQDPDPKKRIEHLRRHVARIRQYLDALDKSLPE